MWLSRQHKQGNCEAGAETGAVTLTGETVAVELDRERRGLAVYAPGGYHWRPALGERVLVLKAGGEAFVVGVPSGDGLEAGEVGLSAPGGAALTLKKDGRLRLEGTVELVGSLAVGGEELENMIRRIAAEVAAGMLG